MEGIEKFWTSESQVENLRAVVAEFYRLVCDGTYSIPPELIANPNVRRYAAFACRCGETHIIRKDFRRSMATPLLRMTPDVEHPEHESYVTALHQFFADTKELDLREVMKPYIAETDDGELVEQALAAQQERIAELVQKICSSSATMETLSDVLNVFAFECAEHQTTHFVRPSHYRTWHKEISAEATSDELRGKVSNLAFKMLVQRSSNAQHDFVKSHPSTKLQNPHFVQPTKAKAKRAKAQKLEVKIVEANKPGVGATQFDHPHLYILKPSLMSDEWLIEYNVCGRKKAYPTREGAESAKLVHHRTGCKKTAYLCSYCSQWHYGNSGKRKTSREKLIRNGMFWYKTDHKKANIFIHKIMFEEWDN